MPFALLSVTDKSGLLPFARGLAELGYTILSTGGTAKLLSQEGVPTIEVSDYTKSPEILDGRVKTLHPKIHGGILFDRANPKHLDTVNKHGISAIDIIVVNLYRFEEEAVAQKLTPEDAIEHIDIGGPTLLRAAAKNWQHCIPVIDPSDYEMILEALKGGSLDQNLRRKLAAKTFRSISQYDARIANFYELSDETPSIPGAAFTPVQTLRYGENPHQKAALYAEGLTPKGFASCQVIQGKELSYNNILDLDAATSLVADLPLSAVVIVKHTNPCGVATGKRPMHALYEDALACDPKSAFGGIIASNRSMDEATAQLIVTRFYECVIAPEFDEKALAILASKPNLRVVKADFANSKTSFEPKVSVRSVQGGFLVQTLDQERTHPESWKVVTKKQPTEEQSSDLVFAMTVAKHVKSNAIVFVKNGVTLGIGAGQMSRVDSAQTAVAKAQEQNHTLKGAILASEAFFPFRDTVDFAAKHEIAAIIQPGGSVRDEESIVAANEANIAMVFTGIRHFRH